MKLTLGKKILLGFIACGIVLIGVGIFTFNNSEKFIESNAWVEHTNQVIYEFQQIQAYVVDAETGTRGYVISGNEVFLEPYTAAKIRIYEHLNNVNELTKDNPTQQKRVEIIGDQILQHINYLEKLIELRKSDLQKTIAIVSSGEGKRITDEIRKLISSARDMEKSLLLERKQESDSDAQKFNVVFAILILVILMILVVVYFIITANLKALRKAEIETANKNWLLTGNSQLNDKTHGEKTVDELARDVIAQLVSYTSSKLGAIYITDDEYLSLAGTYAFDFRKDNTGVIKMGQGLTGQAALDKRAIILSEVPDDYMKINSSLGSAKAKNIIVFPFMYASKVKGVVEMASANDYTELDMQFLNMISENLGIAFNSAQSRTRLKELLEETQLQSEELQSQQEELRQVNEELEEHTQNLKQQQEELQMTNEELEEQTRALEIKNREVEIAREDIQLKNKQLEVSSKYKSEFLANMSHELRTPLNSLLILSKELADNRTENLSEDQVESAEIIYKSGQDLLALINEVLDLSKIEAGKMDVAVDLVTLKDFLESLLKDFKKQAEQKKLKLALSFADNLPGFIRTDSQRLGQIMRNLLSNALKFTERGGVTVEVDQHDAQHIVVRVKDTGIGIPEDKQMAVFEAFQQADGGTSRKYGGTGLGLSISRELAKLLGAKIELQSKANEGSVFSIILPLELKPEQKEMTTETKSSVSMVQKPKNEYINYPAIEDDRHTVSAGDKLVLIIEDDMNFSTVLMKQAHQKGFKCIAASTGEDGLLLAEKYKPNAIILDIDLPGINGHSVLAQLKSRPSVRHIPVHIMSVNERSIEPIKEGAIEYLMKPVTKNDLEEAFNRIENFVNRKMRNLLIVEDDENSRKAMRKLIGNGDVKCYEAATGTGALKMFGEHKFDCIVLDIGLPDMSGFEFIYELEKNKVSIPPIIIYTGRELTREENNELQKYTESIIIKGVKSEERLLDETALFLHRTVSNLPESKQTIINRLYDKEAIFNGRKVLLVDDDMRNIFALSKILKDRGMEVIKADNGINALEMLEKHKDTDIVLMDIMMPEMDGYEAMRKIREQQRLRHLPVIALTAKAMKEDKQKCIDAGANDYITKPVDVERLLSLMRVWLSR